MLAKLYAWYGKRTVLSVAAVIVLLLIAGFVLTFSGTTETTQTETLPVVTTASVGSLTGRSTVSLLGTVEAVSEANIESETAGRVTSVRVALGDAVGAGAVIATLENAAERAALLQAEGAYEAAQAAASSGDLSVTQAEAALRQAQDSALNTLQGTYSTVNNTYFSVIDNYYKNPNSVLTSPEIFNGNRQFLSQERVAFQSILPTWQQSVTDVRAGGDITAGIAEAIGYTERTKYIVDQFLTILQSQNDGLYKGEPTADRINELNTTRTTLSNTIAALTSARTSIERAEAALAQARLGGSSSDAAAANAQVKQALGVLRAAQANLAKTIITTPISGTVNDLDVKVGDYIGSFVPVAKVANNEALEVTVFVGQSDLMSIAVGDPVLIDGAYQGTITNIGAGIDPSTQKTEVKIATATNELTNGDTVSVTLETTTLTDRFDGPLVVPITAVKFSAENGSVLQVEDGVIVERPVVLGVVRGSFVEIIEGIEASTVIVVDARGLTAGTKVETN